MRERFAMRNQGCAKHASADKTIKSIKRSVQSKQNLRFCDSLIYRAKPKAKHR